MSDCIRILKGFTRATIFVSESSYALPYLQQVTRKRLTDYEFDPNLKRMIAIKKFLRYDPSIQALHVPINALDLITDTLEEWGFPYEIEDEPAYKPRDMSIKMKDTFVPRAHQVGAIEYLNSDEPHRKGLAIQTGSGKTVSALAGMIAYGKVGLIGVSRLHQQWLRSIKDFTTATDDQIYVVQGYNSLVRAIEMEEKPEIFIFSLETLREYCRYSERYQDLPRFAKFCEYFGIGFKIFDEVHTNFHAITMIDLSCNIQNNVYLTATFTSNRFTTRRIFEMVYPSSMQFGRDAIVKYTKAFFYTHWGFVPIRESKVSTRRGYSQVKYEKYITSRPMLLKTYLDDIIQPVVYSHYVNIKNPGEKMLILVSTLEMAHAIYKYLLEKFPDYKVVKYVGGIPDTVLVDYEMIVATEKSCGCGSDIKNLRTVINTISTQSPTMTLQMFGRLRELPGIQTEYADICDSSIAAHVRHKEVRKQILSRVAKEIVEYRL